MELKIARGLLKVNCPRQGDDSVKMTRDRGAGGADLNCRYQG